MRKLFLDDIRQVRDACYYVSNPKLYWEEEGWDIVRNYDEFINYIKTKDMPSLISFDHDLADFHYEYKTEEYESLSEEEMIMKFGSMEKTGLDCAKWLVDYCMDNNETLPDFMVHSANPTGKVNIESYLNNAKKHLNI
jgi:hypothetical protein